MGDALYDEDVYEWARLQAAALRRLASERPDLPNDLDLEHVAQEIEDVGKSELRAVKSLLGQVLVHLIKAHADPASLAVAHWLDEARHFQSDARDAHGASMDRLLDLDAIWRGAVATATVRLRGYGLDRPPSVPRACPFALADLLAPDFDAAAALERLRREA